VKEIRFLRLSKVASLQLIFVLPSSLCCSRDEEVGSTECVGLLECSGPSWKLRNDQNICDNCQIKLSNSNNISFMVVRDVPDLR